MVSTQTTGKLYNRTIRLTRGCSLFVNEIQIVNGEGVIVAPVSITGNLAVTGTLSATGNFSIATNKFTVAAASGNTVVAGTLGVTGAVTHTSTTLCSDDVTIASGKSIIGAGTGANGIVLKNLKNQATGTLSGTQKAIVIDIGGVPYYFLVSPTIT